MNAQIYAPFNGLDEMQMNATITGFFQDTGLDGCTMYFQKGAFLTQSDQAFESDRDDGLSLTLEEQSHLA